jgi:hypothetical protein
LAAVKPPDPPDSYDHNIDNMLPVTEMPITVVNRVLYLSSEEDED